MGLTRRIVIFGGAVGLTAVATTAGSALWCNRSSRLAGLPLERLDVGLADIRAPEPLARTLRAGLTPDGLETAFLQHADLPGLLHLECDATRRTALRDLARAEFGRGEILVADRWIVARSEALVAALRWPGVA